MWTKRYSDLTSTELQREAEKLWKQRSDALADGRRSEADVYERKYYMALSYLADPLAFQPGPYRVEGLTELFRLEYVNGVMGWGRHEGSADESEEQVSYPLAMLKPIE